MLPIEEWLAKTHGGKHVDQGQELWKWSSETPVWYGNDNIVENGVAFLNSQVAAGSESVYAH
jgi:hypothetical protein